MIRKTATMFFLTGLVISAGLFATSVWYRFSYIPSSLRFRGRGQVGVWLATYTILAVWLALRPEWMRIAGWIWVVWMLVNALAWIIDKIREGSTAESR